MKHHDLEVIYSYIVAYKQANDGNSPTLREIAEAAGISSTSVVMYNLRHLECLGRLELIGCHRRGICVVGGSWIPPEK
jgi:hypothetical protein